MTNSHPDVIPPLSVVKLVRVTANEPSWCDHAGRIFRIGYYNPQDGLDCVWLVNEAGEYRETVDQEMIRTHFDVLEISGETDVFGVNRVPISPL